MKVAVIMGSKSDWPVLEKTVAELKKFGVEVEARVMSAHRSPELAGGSWSRTPHSPPCPGAAHSR